MSGRSPLIAQMVKAHYARWRAGAHQSPSISGAERWWAEMSDTQRREQIESMAAAIEAMRVTEPVQSEAAEVWNRAIDRILESSQ